MSQLDESSSNQALPTSAESFEWDMNTAQPMHSLQPNTFVKPDGWYHFFDSAAPRPEGNPHLISKFVDVSYNGQGFAGPNFNPFMDAAATMNPSPVSGVGDYDAGFMPSMNPNVSGGPNYTSPTMQASPIISIDDNGCPSSFDQAEPTSQPTPNTPSGNIAWTKQEDKSLMSLKLQGLSYSDIQDEMRKEFGWTRNKNVLGKRFAVLKKRSKPQIKTRIVRDISKRITPEIIKAVGKELQKVTSSDSNNVAAELEDLVHLKFPEFLENLVADVSISLSQAVDDDDHNLSA